MVVVPSGGSYLAESALAGATEYADALDEDVLAASVIPEDASYARRKEWNVGGDAHYDVHVVRRRPPTPIQEIDSRGEFDEEAI